MAQITLPHVHGAIDIPDSAIGANQVLTDDSMMKLHHNSSFAPFRCERIYCGFFRHGDTVPTPVSPVDGYVYNDEEVSYECELAMNQAPGMSAPGSTVGFATGQALMPIGSGNTADGHVYWWLTDIDELTGNITCSTSYRIAGGKETITQDACVKVYAICQRASVMPLMVIPLSGGSTIGHPHEPRPRPPGPHGPGLFG